MMVIAIGPRRCCRPGNHAEGWRKRGERTGRARRTWHPRWRDSAHARRNVALDLVTRMTVVAHDHAGKGDQSHSATKPNGRWR